MILADKIMQLRKQNGWSQEDLAEKLDISRQSVSKWESGASIPDLDKLLKLSNLLGVSTDYLLRDEMEEVIYNEVELTEEGGVRRIGLEEANEAIDNKKRTSLWMAVGTMLCVLCPTPMLLLLGLSSSGLVGFSETVAAMAGLITLLLMVAVGVAFFIVSDSFNKKYEYLNGEMICLDYGVRGVVEKEKNEFNLKYVICTTVATIMCILSVVPLFLGIAIGEEGKVAVGEDFVILLCIDLLLFLVAIAVFLFVWANSMQGVYKQLLQEGEYAKKYKSMRKRDDAIRSIYWMLATAIYLGWSFITNDWHITWILWPVAGVGSGILEAILKLFPDKSQENM